MKFKLSDIVFSKKGKKPDVFSKTKKVGYLPYIDINLFDKGILSRYAKVDKKVTLVNKQDVLVVWDGARFGLSALGWQGVLGSTIVALQSNYLISRFLYYFLQAKFEIIQSKPRGVGIPHVEPFLFWNLQIPVPPMAEQKRIVKKIEELFAVIDKTVKSLNETKEQLSQYRQSVLQNVFGAIAGEFVPLKTILKTSSGGTPSRKNPSFYQGVVPWVKSGELDYNVIQDTEEHISSEALEHSSAKIFPPGSLLIALYGATIGKMAFLGVPAATNQAVCCIFPSSAYDMSFIFYFLRFKHKYLIFQGKGGAQKNISQEILKSLLIPNINLSEQKAIVAKIETAFAAADKAEKAISAALEQAKQLKQSILKRAFEGKLVPQDPNDEPVDLSQLNIHTGKSK